MSDVIPMADLALACRRAKAPSRVLDGLIFRALHPDDDPDRWTRDVDTDDVWHRRDERDLVAFEGPPPFTTSLDVAVAARPEGVRVLSIRELHEDDGSLPIEGARWSAYVARDALDAEEGRGGGVTAALAVIGAILDKMAREERVADEDAS